jgi:hypothetical protein
VDGGWTCGRGRLIVAAAVPDCGWWLVSRLVPVLRIVQAYLARYCTAMPTYDTV